MKRLFGAAVIAPAFLALAGCGSSGPSDADIAQAYMAVGNPNPNAYKDFKVVQCAEDGGNAAYRCDFSYSFGTNPDMMRTHTAKARFLHAGDKWTMSDFQRTSD